MRWLAAYWLIGCAVVGFSLGAHETRCPQDKYMASSEIVATVAIWPVGFAWAFANSRKPACESPAPAELTKEK